MVLGHDSFKGMSIDFGDVNDDGIFDMSVSNIALPLRPAGEPLPVDQHRPSGPPEGEDLDGYLKDHAMAVI